jgi:hypothetical protein
MQKKPKIFLHTVVLVATTFLDVARGYKYEEFAMNGVC